MSDRKISVGLDAPARPGNGFLIGTCLRLGITYPRHPHIGGGIPWRKSERFQDMRFCFLAAAGDIFGKADLGVSDGKVYKSSANACSHSAIPCTARLEKIWMMPN